MAKTKELSFAIERKYNDGNYGSVGYVVGERVTIEEDDNVKQEYIALKERIIRRAAVMDKEVRSQVKVKG